MRKQEVKERIMRKMWIVGSYDLRENVLKVFLDHLSIEQLEVLEEKINRFV
jgi:hypothetical protein